VQYEKIHQIATDIKPSNNSIVTFGDASESHPKSGTSDQLREPHPSESLPIIIRATSGKSKENKAGKVKLSTIVEAGALEAFFIKYAEVCKSGMSGLKKRDRSKVKKKMKAKKKKGGAVGGLEEVKKG
jgi:signal recognition particle subunit SRP14